MRVEIFPYVSVSEFAFKEDIQSIKRKLIRYGSVNQSVSAEMDKRYPSLFIQALDFYVVFLESGNSVRYFEMGGDAYHLNRNLNKARLVDLQKAYGQEDENLVTLDDGFDSPKFGIRVTENDNGGNLVLVYSKEYSLEPEVSPDDIIKYFLSS